MPLHRAYGQTLDSLDVVVVDDAKPMQTILRSILLAAHVARVRAFDNAESALQSMVVEPPHLLITDWHMKPIDGLTLLRTMRRRRMGQVSLVPSILITAHATRTLVEAALTTGTHFVIAKPLSPATLLKRIEFILRDAREFNVGDDETTVELEGQIERVATERQRWRDAYGEHTLQLRESMAETKAAPSGGEDAEATRERATGSGRVGFAALSMPVTQKAKGLRAVRPGVKAAPASPAP